MRHLPAYTLILFQVFYFFHYLETAESVSNRSNLFTLEYNEYCDPEIQGMILNPSKLTGRTFEDKLEKLERLIQVSPVIRLCNIHRYLNCSEKTYKCECWKKPETMQMIYDPSCGECRGIRNNVCEEHSLNIKFFPDQERPSIRELGEVLDTALQIRCAKNAECKVGYQYLRSTDAEIKNAKKHCACKSGHFGPLCDHPTSNFTKILEVAQIWDSSLCEPDISDVFDYTNKHMWYLEQIMILRFHQGKCSKVLEEKLNEIIEFWQNVSYEWTSPDSFNITRNKEDLNEFNLVGKLAQNILDFKSGVRYGLCNRFLGLCCDAGKEICKCPKGSTLQEGRCKRLAGHKCHLLHLPWHLPCVKHASCVADSEEELEGICTCDDGESTPVCRRTVKNYIPFETMLDQLDHDEPMHSSRKRPKGRVKPLDQDEPLHSSRKRPKGQVSQGLELSSGKNMGRENLMVKTMIHEKPRFQINMAPPITLSADDLGKLSQLKKLLVEIIYQRTLPVKRVCNNDDHSKKFYEIVNQLSEWYKNQIPMEIPVGTALGIVKDIFNREEVHCNPTKFLICTSTTPGVVDPNCVNSVVNDSSLCPGTCECDTDLELNEGKCRLPLEAQCTTSPFHLKQRKIEHEFILPVPRCIKGTTCKQDPSNSTIELCILDVVNTGHTHSARNFPLIMIILPVSFILNSL